MTKSSWVAVLFLISVFSVFSLGQTTGAAGSAGIGSADRSPEAGSSVGKDANAVVLQNQAHSGDYLVGNVKVEGNPLLWDPISIGVYCDGQEKAQTYADAKGHFEFRSTQVEGPAVHPKDVKLTASYAGCAVRASLPGYRSSVLTIGNRSLSDNPDVGTVQLSKDERAQGTAISGTSASAPKDALKSFEKARQDLMDQKQDKAKGDLQKAVQAYPQFAMAWYELGRLQTQKDPKEAMTSFEKAAAADPQFTAPYQPLAELQAATQDWKGVQDSTSKYLKLDPDGTPQIWYFDALAKYNLNDKKGAEESAKKALAMDPNHQAPNTEQILAVIEAGRGDIKDALAHLKNSLTYLPEGPNKELVKKQVAQIEGSMAPTK